MPSSTRWTRDQLLAAFALYCRLPFGKFHQHNPEIIALATAIDRTPSAVGMKLCNFASLDPFLSQRGLEGASQADRDLWENFLTHPDDIALQADQAYETILTPSQQDHENAPTAERPTGAPSTSPGGSQNPVKGPALENSFKDLPLGPSEQLRLTTIPRLQSFFRSSVLSSYENRCAISGLEVPELLVASHIIPWSVNEHRRADPRNGLCLNALYDKAFDRGLITFDENDRVLISPRLRAKSANDFHRSTLLEIEGAPLILPTRFPPDHQALTYHRQNIFLPS
jgi:putative restriction endonuclease